MYYMNSNSNTLKNGRNPETGEVLEELRELKPLEVKLDSTVYALSARKRCKGTAVQDDVGDCPQCHL